MTGQVTCNWIAPNGSRSCNRDVYRDSGNCLFHKQNKNREESKLFWKVINYKYNEKDFFRQRSTQPYTLETLYSNSKIRPWNHFMDYCGFFFPEIGAESFIFSASNLPFDSHQIGWYDFSYAKFEGRIEFDQYQFSGRVSFDNAEFCQAVLFRNCNFSYQVSFIDTKGLSCNMLAAHLFEGSLFSGDQVIFENLNRGLDLTHAKFSRDTRLQVKNLSTKYPLILTDTYRRAQEQCVITGQFKEAREYQYLSLECRRKGLESEVFKSIKGYCPALISYLWATLFKWTTGYLLRPWRLISTMVGVIVTMAIFYMFAGIGYSEIFGDKTIYKTINLSLGGFGDSLYFSIVTFTTLGYGDFAPSTSFARLLCSVESFLGIILSGMFIVSVSKQILRE